MVIIKNNSITMTRGDSLNVKIAVVKNRVNGKLPNSRELVTPEELEGCEIVFALSRFFPGEVNYKLWLTKNIPTSTMALVLSQEDTKNIPLGVYNFDIKLKTPKPESEQISSEDEWSIDTFISGAFKLTGECEGEEGIINDYLYGDPDNGTI